jgi:hypothetical protein
MLRSGQSAQQKATPHQHPAELALAWPEVSAVEPPLNHYLLDRFEIRKMRR